MKAIKLYQPTGRADLASLNVGLFELPVSLEKDVQMSPDALRVVFGYSCIPDNPFGFLRFGTQPFLRPKMG